MWKNFLFLMKFRDANVNIAVTCQPTHKKSSIEWKYSWLYGMSYSSSRRTKTLQGINAILAPRIFTVLIV